jgi:hypothetical protein
LLKLGPFGGGPGLYFDLARFTFQFPPNTSAANAPLAEKQKTIVPKTNILRFIGDSSGKIGKRIEKIHPVHFLLAEWYRSTKRTGPAGPRYKNQNGFSVLVSCRS